MPVCQESNKSFESGKHLKDAISKTISTKKRLTDGSDISKTNSELLYTPLTDFGLVKCASSEGYLRAITRPNL